MDNAQPFAVMPSRAGADGLGAFSFYDHVFLPENLKDLVREHDGERYRSQLVIRVNGSKKKTEAFLHIQRGVSWLPVRLPDGTVSDGKLDTFPRRVEGILGSAETFFTSAFSAQGRRQLSAYKNAEIKTLLADLLGLEEIRVLGARASETVRMVKAGLGAIRLERAALQADADGLAQEVARFGKTREQVESTLGDRTSRQVALESAMGALAAVQAQCEAAAHIETRRAELLAERVATIGAGRKALEGFDAQDQREIERLAQLDRRIAQRVTDANQKLASLAEQRRKLEAALRIRPEVENAAAFLPQAELEVVQFEARAEALRRDVDRLKQLRSEEKAAREQIAGIEREAGQAALAAQSIARRLGLTAEVPCAGTDFQGQCRLLGDAFEARRLRPSADRQVAKLTEEKTEATARLQGIIAALAELLGVDETLEAAERDLRASRGNASRLAQLAARLSEMDQAAESLARVVAELVGIPAGIDAESPDGAIEREGVQTALTAISARREATKAEYRGALARIDAAIAALPPTLDPWRVQQAERGLTDARAAVANGEEAHLRAVRDHQGAEDVIRRRSAVELRIRNTDVRARHVEEQLGIWTLFARCMSNDGVIALTIDDAGPTLTALANDLLLACYGPRFIVSIKTQVETAKGEAREGFDIVVYDAESGDSKSVTLMSGGERVVINECLTRAIALYIAQNSGRRYETLFADDTDGSLDPDRKRMFMAMKREVLRLGGYRQEFFVSQTPELTAMADAVINLEAYCCPATSAA